MKDLYYKEHDFTIKIYEEWYNPKAVHILSYTSYSWTIYKYQVC